MQATLVIIMALGGLGCHNQEQQALQPSPAFSSSEGYPGGAFRATVMSFFHGRDDVPTARQIQASFYSGRFSGRSGFMAYDVPSAAPPSRYAR
jgi:hypothetical protein